MTRGFTSDAINEFAFRLFLSDHLLFYLCFLSNGAVLFIHLDCDLTVLHSLNDIKALYHTPVNR